MKIQSIHEFEILDHEVNIIYVSQFYILMALDEFCIFLTKNYSYVYFWFFRNAMSCSYHKPVKKILSNMFNERVRNVNKFEI